MAQLSEGDELKCDEKVSYNPIFIVGYYHSGTTLLRDIIAKDPSIFSLKNESLFFRQLGTLRRQYPDLTNKATLVEYITFLIKLANLGFVPATLHGNNYSLVDLGIDQEKLDAIVDAAEQTLPRTTGDKYVMVFRLVAEKLTLYADKERWLDKGPGHVLHLQTILSEIEGSRAIEIVRDPRGTLGSRKLRMRKAWQESRERGGAFVDRSLNYDPILDSLRWRQMIRAGVNARSKFPERVLRVRYEDLVGQPETVVPQLAEFLGMSYRPELLNVDVVNSTSWAGENKSAGIVKIAVDKWREALTQEELYLIQTILRDEMNQLGYELEPLSRRFSAYVRIPLAIGQSTVRLSSRIRRRGRISSRRG